MDGRPSLLTIEGDPIEWTETLKRGGRVSTSTLSGYSNETLFQKLGFHYNMGRVTFSDGKDGNVEIFTVEDVFANRGSLRTRHAFTSVEVWTQMPFIILGKAMK